MKGPHTGAVVAAAVSAVDNIDGMGVILGQSKNRPGPLEGLQGSETGAERSAARGNHRKAAKHAQVITAMKLERRLPGVA